MDVDFFLRKIPNTPGQLKHVLEEIIETFTGNILKIFAKALKRTFENRGQTFTVGQFKFVG
ncbi:hypothetical protein AALA78_15700 [Lachnospiraceae bacterium 42-17]|jgi:hypothetical protein